MIRGRKDKWFLCALSALAALGCAVLAAPAAASGPASNEYDLALPDADGGSTDAGTATTGGGSGPVSNSQTGAATPSSSGSTGGADSAPSGTATQANSNDSNQNDGRGGAAGARESTSGTSLGQPQSRLKPSDDSGGMPALLIGLAVLAAAGVGVGAWRLRRMNQPGGAGTGAQVTHGA